MDLPQEPLSLAAAILALLLASLTAAALFSRLFLGGQRPRRRYAPLVGTVLHQWVYFDRLHDYQTELSFKHRTFRLYAPFRQQLYTVDPATVEHILKTNFHKFGKGSFSYMTARDLFGDGIFLVDGDKWRQQRKLASYEFSTKVLRDYSSAIFKTNAAKLAATVSKSSDAGLDMDIQDLFMRATMDSIFKVGFGVDLGTLDGSNERGVRFTRAFDDSSVSIKMRFVDVLWKVKKLLNVGHEASLRRDVKVIDEFVHDIIRAKVEKKISSDKDKHCDSEEEKKRGDMLSRFLLEREKDPEGMSRQYLRDIVLNFLIAGKDTTAGTLSWFMFMMCKHPSIQDKLAREIEAAATEHRGSAAGDFEEFASLLTDDAIERMHYLHAALSETLRLYPAVPMVNKSCLADDTLPGGFDVRKGDVVYFQPYAMGRMEFLWGEDAAVFRPERWIDESGMFRPESPFKFTAFQAGPRICLGREFAYRQMKIFAAVLLRFFEFKLRGGREEAVRYRTTLTLHVDGGLHVYAVPR